MRTGTDAMLLGSWAEPGNARRVLDVGTGSGILALMIAQKSDARVDAIDIDRPSVNEASLNFVNSPWRERLTIHHESLQHFCLNRGDSFGYIISNPPFFSRSLTPTDIRKRVARHDDRLPIEDLVSIAAELLTKNGTLGIVFPAASDGLVVEHCRKHNLFRKKALTVRTKANSQPVRILSEFTNAGEQPCTEQELVIRDGHGNYSAEYLHLTRDFHFF